MVGHARLKMIQTISLFMLIEPEYLFHRSKTAAAKSALESMAEKMLEGLDGKSDYDKALIIHDRLAERVVYKRTDNERSCLYAGNFRQDQPSGTKIL